MGNIIGLDGKPIKKQVAQAVKFTSEKGVEFTVDYNEPEFQIFAVNNFENGKLMGSCLFSEQFVANTVAAAMNQEYAKLEVNMEAKVVSLPVFAKIAKE